MMSRKKWPESYYNKDVIPIITLPLFSAEWCVTAWEHVNDFLSDLENDDLIGIDELTNFQDEYLELMSNYAKVKLLSPDGHGYATKEKEQIQYWFVVGVMNYLRNISPSGAYFSCQDKAWLYYGRPPREEQASGE